MPYLNGIPFNPITSFGKVTEGNFDVKNNIWKEHTKIFTEKLSFQKTHQNTIVSQVREKTNQHFTLKMPNITKQRNAIPSRAGITSFGKDSISGNVFPNFGSQFHTQNTQIQNRRGSTVGQQKLDNKIS